MKIRFFIIVLILILFGIYRMEKEAQMSELIDKINSIDDKMIIDVRSEEEYEEDGIESHRNIPYEFVLETFRNENVAKDSNIVLYCHSGNRAEQAKSMLEKNGYLNVYNVLNLDYAKRIK